MEVENEIRKVQEDWAVTVTVQPNKMMHTSFSQKTATPHWCLLITIAVFFILLNTLYGFRRPRELTAVKLTSLFPNVCVALHIFLTLPVTVPSG